MKEGMEVMIKEVAGVVRAALVGWPETARLCLVLVVVTATAWTIVSLLS